MIPYSTFAEGKRILRAWRENAHSRSIRQGPKSLPTAVALRANNAGFGSVVFIEQRPCFLTGDDDIGCSNEIQQESELLLH